MTHPSNSLLCIERLVSIEWHSCHRNAVVRCLQRLRTHVGSGASIHQPNSSSYCYNEVRGEGHGCMSTDVTLSVMGCVLTWNRLCDIGGSDLIESICAAVGQERPCIGVAQYVILGDPVKHLQTHPMTFPNPGPSNEVPFRSIFPDPLTLAFSTYWHFNWATRQVCLTICSFLVGSGGHS